MFGLDLGFLDTTFHGFCLSEMGTFWSPLIIFVIGVTLYSIFVFKFYRFLARKRILDLKIHEYDIHITLKKFLHIMEYLFFFPVVVFFWFFVMSLLLIIISVNQTIETVLFISVAFVSVVRIATYYNEDLAKDLAKLIPFALLALFIMDASYMSWDNSFFMLQQIPLMWRTLIYYLFFVIFLESFLRLVTLKRYKKVHKKKDHEEFLKMIGE